MAAAGGGRARQLSRRSVLLLARPPIRRAAAEAVSELAPRGRDRDVLAGAVRRLVHPVVPLYLRRTEFFIVRAGLERGALGPVSAPEFPRGDGVGGGFYWDRLFPRPRLQHRRQYRELARLCAARRVRHGRQRNLATAPPPSPPPRAPQREAGRCRDDAAPGLTF